MPSSHLHNRQFPVNLVTISSGTFVGFQRGTTVISVWVTGSSITSFRKGSHQRNNQQNGHYLERRVKLNSVTCHHKLSRKSTSPLGYKKIMKVCK